MIDWDRLQDLKREIGEEDFAEVAELFLEEMAESMAQLRDGTEAASPEMFHLLRGSAANLGFAAFAKGCADAEQALGMGQTVDLPGLDTLYQASLTAAAVALPQFGKAA